MCTVPDVRDSTSYCPVECPLPSIPQAVHPCCRATLPRLSKGSGDPSKFGDSNITHPQQYASLRVRTEGVASVQATAAALWGGRELLATQVSIILPEGGVFLVPCLS